MAVLEFFKSSNKWGWRVRNDAGVIEFSRSAAFATQALAASNAATDTRGQMAGLGIIEGGAPVPPVVVKHVTAVGGPASGQVTATWDFTASRIDRDDGAGGVGWGTANPPTIPFTFWDLTDGTTYKITVTPVDGSTPISVSVVAGVSSTPPTIPPTIPPTGPAPLAWLEPFSATTSIWKTAIGSGIQQVSSNDARATKLASMGGGTINCTFYSHPIYHATTSDPMANVSGTQYRIPVGAQPAQGTDAHMHVVDPTGRWLDECWNMHNTGGSNWSAGYHVRTDLLGPGFGQGGVRAYGGSAVGGLIRAAELSRGLIQHALAMALPANALGPVSNPHAWPATTEDGDYQGSYSGTIPMGTLVFIPASQSLAQFTGAALTFATALRDYGAYVTDRSAGLTFYAEPTNGMNLSLVTQIQSALGAVVPMLRVAANSAVGSVGGGGTPRVPAQTSPIVG